MLLDKYLLTPNQTAVDDPTGRARTNHPAAFAHRSLNVNIWVLVHNHSHLSIKQNHCSVTPSSLLHKPGSSCTDTAAKQMFTQPTTSPPTLATSDDPASPTAPSRSSRLRGLSYLRSYTHSHLSADVNQHTNSPSTSLPSSSSLRPSYFVRSASYPDRTNPTDEQCTPQQNPAASSTTYRLRNEVGSRSPSRQGPETQSTLPEPVTGQLSVNTALGGIARIMGRRRSGSTSQGPTPNSRRESDATPSNLTGHPPDQMPTIKLTPHQDPRAARPSLIFPQTSRTLPHEDCVIRVGRYSERDANPNPPPNVPSSAPVGFKSKVVSRRHCEFWCSNGQWYIKDVKSSSGTFLNHIRLSQPSAESRPFPVNDGDVIQLGIDFRGGEEMIFRCVKIRVECNRAWQKTLNNFKYVHWQEFSVLTILTERQCNNS